MSADRRPAATRATRADVSRDTAQILRRGHPAAPSATALRTRSVHARELLVELAWPGRCAADIDAMATAMAADPDPGGPVPDGVDVQHLGHYARVLCLQAQLPDDVARGRRILEALARSGRLDEVHAHAVQVLLQLRAQEGDREGCAQLLDHRGIRPDVRQAIVADLANPFHPVGVAEPAPDPAREEVDRWLALVNEALLSPDFAELRLDPTLGDTPFDQLTTAPPPPRPARTAAALREGRPLVTVVVSSYRPGPALQTAVRSLAAQTWPHLEILVVDDASPDRAAAEEALRAVEALDPRVRVIRKAVNGGTYRARNTALRQARGQFLTCLDSDDWLHPQAVETLLGALLEDPSRMAAISSAVRVPETLVLTRVGYPLRVLGAPTLMIRLDPVLGRLGFFDPTRKSADTEYARRIVAAFGNRTVHRVEECLLLLRSGDTLSSDEFAARWRHPARHAYKNVYTPWHQEVRAGATAYLDPQERALVDPLRWRTPRDPAWPLPRHYDLVVAGDWRRWGGPQRSMLEEIRAAKGAGLRVGVLHLEAMRFATQVDLPLCVPVTDLIRRREVDQVQLDDPVEVEVLRIRYPLVLMHLPHLPSGAFTPGRLDIVANQAPQEPDGTDRRYVVADVTERARELFGVAPYWVPQSPVIRAALQQQDPGVRLAEQDSPGVIDVAQWWVEDRPLPGAGGSPVRVGRYSRDDVAKHPPTLEKLLAAYDLGPGCTVRLMGSTRTWARLVQEAGIEEGDPRARPPESWEVLPVGAEEPRDFLAGIDFFLYQDHPDRVESFPRVLLEAAASGVVVITDPRHRATFGDLLDYAQPSESRALIEEYVDDPDRYRARVATARRVIEENYAHASFAAALRRGDAGQENDAVPPWSGAAELEVRRGGTEPSARLEVTVRGSSGQGLTTHRLRLRSAADGQRADELVLVHTQDLSSRTRAGIEHALAEPAEADVDPAVLEVLRTRPDLVAVVRVRDGDVDVVVDAPHGRLTISR